MLNYKEYSKPKI